MWPLGCDLGTSQRGRVSTPRSAADPVREDGCDIACGRHSEYRELSDNGRPVSAVISRAVTGLCVFPSVVPFGVEGVDARVPSARGPARHPEQMVPAPRVTRGGVKGCLLFMSSDQSLLKTILLLEKFPGQGQNDF